ncbi:hypothetical protein A2U01_0055714, partial [Trifolium medium]|nr:hypothetical protein [Trifolium medium]
MRYHGVNDKVVTIRADNKALKRYSRMVGNDFSSVTLHNTNGETPSASTKNTDFDLRLDEEKKAENPLPLEVRTKFERPKPDGEFITVQLDNNPTKTVKIGVNLPQRIQEALIRCLKAN